MIDLFDIIKEAEMTCESFSDPHIYQAWKTLHKYGISWKSAMPWNVNIQWDKLEKEDVVEISKAEFKKEFTNMRRLKMGYEDRPFMILGFKEERLTCMFEPYHGTLGKIVASYSSDTKFEWYYSGEGRGNRMKVTEMYDKLSDCDYLVKVYIDKSSARAIIDNRVRNKAGMIPDRDEYDHKSRHHEHGVLGKNAGGRSDYVPNSSFYGYCESLAQQARSAWKKIVAENKFKRTADTTEVDNAVQETLSLMMKLSAWATKNPDKISTFDLERMMKRVYDKYSSYQSGTRYNVTGNDEILVCYQKYCEACMYLQKGNSWDASSSLASRDKLHDLILKKCAEFKKKCNDYGIS